MRVVIHLSAKGFACIHKVFMQQRIAAGSALRKQVDVDKNLRRLVEQIAALPSVKQVRR